mgnify:CR=1 FL=1
MKISKAYRLYRSLRKKGSRDVVLLRVGNEYHLFDDCARAFARSGGIALGSVRLDGRDVPHARVAVHEAEERAIDRVIEAGDLTLALFHEGGALDRRLNIKRQRPVSRIRDFSPDESSRGPGLSEAWAKVRRGENELDYLIELVEQAAERGPEPGQETPHINISAGELGLRLMRIADGWVFKTRLLEALGGTVEAMRKAGQAAD